MSITGTADSVWVLSGAGRHGRQAQTGGRAGSRQQSGEWNG